MPILHLPNEMLHKILGFVKTDSYIILGPVCSAFRNCFTPSQKITRVTKFFQSPQLVAQAPRVEFKNPCLLDDLITQNHIAIIPLLLSRGLGWDHFCVERAAEVDSRHFFDWLKNTDLAWLPENAHYSAAHQGNLELMMYLVESGAGYPDDRAIAVAKQRRDGRMMQWLSELRFDRVYEMVIAAREDNVHAFEQMETSDYAQVDRYITQACANSSLEVLEFFRSIIGIGPTVADVAMATVFKRMEVLEWFGEFYPEQAKNLIGH